MSTKNLTFSGKEADIGITFKDTVVVTNTGNVRNFTVALYDEARCNSDKRSKTTINPKEFKLEKVLRNVLFLTRNSISFRLSTERGDNCDSLCEDLLHDNRHGANRDQDKR